MPITYRLATVSPPGGTPAPTLVVDEIAYSLRDVSDWLAMRRLSLKGTETMVALLEHWAHNAPLLEEAAQAILADRATGLRQAGQQIGTLTFHPPVNLPRQIFCAGANYKRHVVQIIMSQATEATKNMTAEERRTYGERLMDERAARGSPFFFVKAQSAVTGPYNPIVLPSNATQPDWELELAVVIGKRAYQVTRTQALEYVAGYTIANDVTSRDRLLRAAGDAREMGFDLAASKNAPTYLPLGPYIVPASAIADPQALRITLKLNGEIKQDESTSDMIFPVARLVEYASSFAMLLPGDVICTGSPAGNGVHYGRFLQPGDVVESSISGLGVQRNVCVAQTG